jgi:hypothetical protein
MTALMKNPKDFLRRFESWFSDNIGFRERLIRLHQGLNRRLAAREVQYTDGQYIYLIGERGHHFFAGVNGEQIPKFQGKQFLSDEQLQNMAAKLEEVKEYLGRKGIPLVVMLCPDKESIYPEFYPKLITRGPEPVQLDVITNYLKEHTSVDVFNIRQALVAEKNAYLLYPLIDNFSSAPDDCARYNRIGAFFGYRELMKHITAYFPSIIPYELKDIDISYDELGIPIVSLKPEVTFKKLDKSFFDDVNVIRPFLIENEAYENTKQGQPTILFLRDSYTYERYIGKFLPQHFGKTVLIHYMNIKHFEEYNTRYKPDIVVFEGGERGLRVFPDVLAEIPTLSE